MESIEAVISGRRAELAESLKFFEAALGKGEEAKNLLRVRAQKALHNDVRVAHENIEALSELLISLVKQREMVKKKSLLLFLRCSEPQLTTHCTISKTGLEAQSE